MKTYELFIFEDGDGYTSCVNRQGDVDREIARRPMMAPIKVYHWQRTGSEFGRFLGWVLVHTYMMYS